MSSHPGCRRFSKRGGKFTRQQLEIVTNYLQTKENPDRHSLLNANFGWDSSSDGPLVRLKTACKRLSLNNENMLIHITGKNVIPVEEFISTIQRAHKGEKEDEHLHFSETLKRLSENYTIGRRTYGMSKKLIEAVVKSCNSGLCWKKKKKKRKREYEETVKRFTRKCLAMGETTVSGQIENEQDVTKQIQGETNENSQAYEPSTSSTDINGKAKKPKNKVKLKKKKKIPVNKLPSLVQMTQKSTTVTASNATSNKSEIISIGPFPVSVLKNGTNTGQYQLGLLLPVVSQQGTMSQNTTTTGQTGNTKSLCIPVVNVSSAPGVSGTTGKVASNVNVSGNITKTINLSQMQFSTLLQSMAKNSQTDMNKVSISSKLNDETTHQPNMGINVPLEKGRSSLKLTFKQKLQVQSKEISHSPSKDEPPQKKTKIVKISTEGKVNTCTDKKTANEENMNKSENDDVIIVDDKKTDENNNLNDNNSQSQSIELDEDWSDDSFQALEYVKNSGMYKSCLKALCSLGTEDFETVMDRMDANIFSEGQNPFVPSYYPVTDPPYSHIWYFYREICQEKNIFSRMIIVMKDIRIDMMRSLMQELLAHDRLKRKITYMESLIKKNKVYLDMCAAKSFKRNRKKRKKLTT
ncbi:uncharacterized protein LOC134721335 isoform X1 [Mytilus trossulus]|uniref:uncharacterized protein LOC134721335 isoform X1 n=1 Tax=Mytilus trossulus TaxID=6551 RepID=UPI003006C183